MYRMLVLILGGTFLVVSGYYIKAEMGGDFMTNLSNVNVPPEERNIVQNSEEI